MKIEIPNLDQELSFKTSRSGGAGGQNVNKVASKVELNFDIAASQVLSEDQKNLLKERLAHKINKEGVLQLVSQNERTQLGNKQDVLAKFYRLIAISFEVKQVRKASKPNRAAKEKRLKTKKHNSELKLLRRKL